MSIGLRRLSNSLVKMAEQINSSASDTTTAGAKRWSFWPSLLRWIPTSTDHIITAEKRLLSLVRTAYTQEQVNIGSGPPGSKVRWFRSTSNEPRFINTVTFESKEGSPTLVMVHGYGASQGFFFRNFDALAKHFKVIAIDQLGWGGSSRPDFTCKSTEETENWFIDSFEEWRKAQNLSNFILLGHSFGGYVAAKYALKHPEHVQQLILVGPAGFSSETEHMSERMTQFRATWKGAVLNHLWESNFTPMKVIRGLGPWGPDLVRRYTNARFTAYSNGDDLTEESSRLFSDYIYHTLAAKPSGELCLKYIFSFGAFAKSPLLYRKRKNIKTKCLRQYVPLNSPSLLTRVGMRELMDFMVSSALQLMQAPDWKVPTGFIYGHEDWMNYQGAQQARKNMKVPCEIIRVPQAGHFVFLENASAFHSAVLYACRRFISPWDNDSLPQGLLSV